MSNLYPVLYPVVRTALSLWFHIEVYGLEHIPDQGPAIIVVNHISGFDPPVCGVILPRHAYFLAKAELFEWRLLRWVLEGVNAHPVHRGKPDRAALKWALAVLQQGELLMVFPEGHRSDTGELQAARPGVVFLAKKSQAPLVPIGISGRYGLRRRVCYEIGEPFTIPPDLESEAAQHLVMAKIGEQVERGQRKLAVVGKLDQAGIK